MTPLTHLSRGAKVAAWKQAIMLDTLARAICRKCGATPVRYFTAPSQYNRSSAYDVTFLCEECGR